MTDLFQGFDSARVEVPGAETFLRHGGSGPPLLLLHGYPQTHAMWHQVAATLVEHFSVFMPDLRGYGDSRGPDPARSSDTAYAKRTMANDAVALMQHFGHTRFALAGHDRGGRVGYRLALDHPDRVSRFAALDIVPTLDAWQAMDSARAHAGYHWLFLAQAGGMPERLIGADPDYYLEHLLSRWALHRDRLDTHAVAAYREAMRRPSVIAAHCADYRAGYGIDAELDRVDRAAGRRIACPVQVLWAPGYLASKTSAGPLDAWRAWADDVSDMALQDCGHFVTEEQPLAAAEALLRFFGAA